jgi:hypothetical protein
MMLIARGYHSAAGWQQQMLLVQAYQMQQQRQGPRQREALQQALQMLAWQVQV